MALNIDISRALRTLDELRGLVEAIRDAPAGEPETDWLEWKTGLDLASSAEHRFESAKHILGFGNRSPLDAQPYMEGTAYLILGVEPGNLAGVAAPDPADMSNWINRYVAPGRPRWRPDAVEVDGRNVIVFTIEAPRWGESVCTLQQGFAGFQAGRIFIRESGRTLEASPGVVTQLETRLLRGAEDIDVDLELELPEGPLLALELSAERKERWLDSEKSRLLSSLPSDSRFRYVTADSRKPEGFVEEVEEYLARAGARWHALVLKEAIESRLAVFRCALVNRTPRNFQQTVVELQLPQGVMAFLDEDDPRHRLDAPDPPEPYGRSVLAMSSFAGLRPIIHREDDEVVLDGGSDLVRFYPRDLRPVSRLPLPEVHLWLDPERSGTAVDMGWRATSTSATNFSSGAVSVQVASEVASMDPPAEVGDED